MAIIRPATPADVDVLLALRRENRDYLERWEPDTEPADGRYTRTGVREWVDRPHQFVVLDAGEVVGTVQLSNVAEYAAVSSAMTGYWIAATAAGRGLATRAVGEILDYAFDELGLHRVEAGTHVDNIASQRVLEHNGFTRVGTLRRHLLIGGVWHDHYLYELIEDDR